MKPIQSLSNTGKKESDASGVKWNHRHQYIQRNNHAIKGITKLLMCCFYPNWLWYNAIKKSKDTLKQMNERNPTMPIQQHKNSLIQQHARQQNDATVQIKGSLSVGNKLDKDIKTTLKLQLKYKLPLQAFFDEETLEKHLGSVALSTHVQQLKKIHAQRNPYIRKFWKMLFINDWVPVDTQVPLCHCTYNIGTLADVVVQTKKQKYMILEVKTGFDSYLKINCDKEMQFPFQLLNDCPQNQHILQLLATEVLFQMTYPQRQLTAGYVLLFNNDGLTQYQIPKKLYEQQYQMHMFDQMSQRK